MAATPSARPPSPAACAARASSRRRPSAIAATTGRTRYSYYAPPPQPSTHRYTHWTKLVPEGNAPTMYLVVVIRETILADGTPVPVAERAYLKCSSRRTTVPRAAYAMTDEHEVEGHEPPRTAAARDRRDAGFRRRARRLRPARRVRRRAGARRGGAVVRRFQEQYLVDQVGGHRRQRRHGRDPAALQRRLHRAAEEQRQLDRARAEVRQDARRERAGARRGAVSRRPPPASRWWSGGACRTSARSCPRSCNRHLPAIPGTSPKQYAVLDAIRLPERSRRRRA